MQITIPDFGKDIEDEGLLIFLGFVYKITYKYGYEHWYTTSQEDIGCMSNKNVNNLAGWLRSCPAINDNMEIGEAYSHIITWRLKKRARQNGTCKVEISTERAKMIWVYLLGCMNNDLLIDEMYTKQPGHNRPNTMYVTEFRITREAMGYIKVKDRW